MPQITKILFLLKGVQQEETVMNEDDGYDSKEVNIKEANDGYDSREVKMNGPDAILNESTQLPNYEGQFLALPNFTEKNAQEKNTVADQPSSDSTTLTTSQDLKDETITESPIYLHIHLPEESGRSN